MAMKTMIELFAGSSLLCTYFIYSGAISLNSKLSKSRTTILFILGMLFFIAVNYLLLDNFTRVITTYVAVLFCYKGLFKKNIAQCAIVSLISYLLLVVAEILFMLTLTTLQNFNVITNIEVFTGSVIANLFICCVASLLFLLIRNPISLMLIKVKDNNKFALFFTFLSVMIAIGVLLFNMAFSNWRIDNKLFLNIVMTICLVYIGIVIIKQHVDKAKINSDYEEYVKYSKESENLVEQYSISQHENKNELIIIRSMVHKSNKKLLEYLDEIILSKDNIKNSWIKSLKYIPFGGLKGILHNKISSMKADGINVFLSISKEVGDSDLKNLTMKENNQLSKIIGVFLDNAKEAAMLSDDKEVSICIYIEEENVVFEISNTYINEVNLEKIYKAGHSSKGKNRGYGLTLVKSIIEENADFENITKIIDDYFVQILRLKRNKS